MVSKSKNKIHETWGPSISGTLYMWAFGSPRPTSWRSDFQVNSYPELDPNVKISYSSGQLNCVKISQLLRLRPSLQNTTLSLSLSQPKIREVESPKYEPFAACEAYYCAHTF